MKKGMILLYLELSICCTICIEKERKTICKRERKTKKKERKTGNLLFPKTGKVNLQHI